MKQSIKYTFLPSCTRTAPEKWYIPAPHFMPMKVTWGQIRPSDWSRGPPKLAELPVQTGITTTVPFPVCLLSVFLGGVMTKRLGCRLTGIAGGLLASIALFCSCWVATILQLTVTASMAGKLDKLVI